MSDPAGDQLGPDHDVTLHDVVTALASRVNWAGDESARDTLDRWLAANAPTDDDEDDEDQGDVDTPVVTGEQPTPAAAAAAPAQRPMPPRPGKGSPHRTATRK